MDVEDFAVTTEKSRGLLNERQLFDYKEHRKQFIQWLMVFGKNPAHAEGYSRDTIDKTAYRTDNLFRWVWEQEGYTLNVSHDLADAFMRELAYSDYSNTHKANTQKSIKRYYKWLSHERGGELWEPVQTFSSAGSNQPRDYLTVEERKLIREAALEYGSIPSYKSVTPGERDQWKAYLAQRYDKPKSEITPKDWKKANGWKYTTITWASLDAGLRPVEVERARVSWVDTENGVLRIPESDSSKNRDNWVVGLTDRTSKALARWLEERKLYERYEGTDALWLTRQGNPYQSTSLRRLLINLCEIAGIPTENRRMSWYCIRHSVGTYMTREEDLAAAQAQLRHKSELTTMKYDNVPVEARKQALDRMG